MTDVVLVLSTVPDDPSAERIARTLVEEKLAACVNLFSPMRSVYRWNGDVEWATERQIVIKTSSSLAAAVQERLKALHSYELPECLVVHVGGGAPDYLAWIADQLDAR